MNDADVVKVPTNVTPVDRDVSFESGGVKLTGKLMLPAGRIDVARPAVLLISGSGPTDGDGNQPGLKVDTLLQIAKGLAEAGIVTFRFDKRAVAKYADQWPKDPAQLGTFFSWTNHQADAVAAWEAMRKSALVDKAHCAILGHSEGGMIALSIVRKTDAKALVLVACPGRPFDTIVHEQLSKQAVFAGDKGKEFVATSDRLFRQVRATGQVPSDVPTELKGLFNPSVGVYLKEICAVNPVDLAKAFTGPVLVINGQADKQVSPTADAEALFKAVESRAGSKLVLLPLASHNLKPVESEMSSGFEGEVVPDAIEAMHNFLTPIIGGEPGD